MPLPAVFTPSPYLLHPALLGTYSAKGRDECPPRVDAMHQQSIGRMITQVPVLIVDGNPHMTAMLQRFLTRQQVDTLTVSHPAEARALLAQHTFLLILTDRFAPSDGGLDLLRYVRQTVPATPVILMIAFGAPALHQQALVEGAYAC